MNQEGAGTVPILAAAVKHPLCAGDRPRITAGSSARAVGPSRRFLIALMALGAVLLCISRSASRAAGVWRSMAYDDRIVARLEVGSAAFRQVVELPVPGDLR